MNCIKAGRKWKAGIRHLGQRRYLGCFSDEAAAASAYDAAARELHGTGALLNFSNEEGQGEDMPEAKGVKRKRAIDKVAAPNIAN